MRSLLAVAVVCLYFVCVQSLNTCGAFNGTHIYAIPETCANVTGRPFCVNTARDGLPADVWIQCVNNFGCYDSLEQRSTTARNVIQQRERILFVIVLVTRTA
jgi:hypothetical protein